jgi:hypothetical protein
VRIARQFLVMFALCSTAAFCALAGSALANWITVIDHRPVAIGGPARATLNAPAPGEQLPHLLEEAGVDGREPSMDLYGNEVTEAVAKYLLDSTGAVYEEHSPQTEVPRLAAPTS